jgi:hypothetical protein
MTAVSSLSIPHLISHRYCSNPSAISIIFRTSWLLSIKVLRASHIPRIDGDRASLVRDIVMAVAITITITIPNDRFPIAIPLLSLFRGVELARETDFFGVGTSAVVLAIVAVSPVSSLAADVDGRWAGRRRWK